MNESGVWLHVALRFCAVLLSERDIRFNSREVVMECTKCSKCGLPRNGHFDRKSRTEKRRIISRCVFKTSSLTVTIP